MYMYQTLLQHRLIYAGLFGSVRERMVPRSRYFGQIDQGRIQCGAKIGHEVPLFC